MQTITVDMTPGFRQPTIHYSQNDVGTTFAIDLRSRFGDTLPASPTVKIQATKPSGFGFSIEADSVVGSVATFTTVDTMTDEAGRFQAELEISEDSVVLYTANFYMEGEANPHPIGTTDGSQETIIPTLTLLVERVEAAAASVLDMTVNATTLAAGSQATYSYDEDTNTVTFGIPQGEAGAGAAGVTASAYSSSSTYAVGDYVIHNSNLYRCTTAITTAEAFTAAHWTQVVLGDDVADLKSDLSEGTINLRNDSNILKGYIELSLQVIYPADNARSLYIPVEANEVYCIQKASSTRFNLGFTSTTPAWNGAVTNIESHGTDIDCRVTAPSGATHLVLTYISSAEIAQADQILDSIIITKGDHTVEYIDPISANDKIMRQQFKRFKWGVGQQGGIEPGAVSNIDGTDLPSVTNTRVRTDGMIYGSYHIEVNSGYRIFRVAKYDVDGTFIGMDAYDTTVTELDVENYGLYSRIVFTKTTTTAVIDYQENIIKTFYKLGTLLPDEIKVAETLLASKLTFESGGIDSDGNEVASSTRVRNKFFIKGSFHIKVKSGYKVFRIVRYSTSGEYLGYVASGQVFGRTECFMPNNGYYARVVISKSDTSATINPNEDIIDSINPIEENPIFYGVKTDYSYSGDISTDWVTLMPEDVYSVYDSFVENYPSIVSKSTIGTTRNVVTMTVSDGTAISIRNNYKVLGESYKFVPIFINGNNVVGVRIEDGYSFPNTGSLTNDGGTVLCTFTGGSIASGEPIYKYDFRFWNESPTVINGFTDDRKNRIFIIGGVHGYEPYAIFGHMMFFKDLMDNWNTNEQLVEIRENADFTIIPCLNPWSLRNKVNYNAYGVDLNRNGSDRFELTSQSDHRWSGPQALSEPETQALNTELLSAINSKRYAGFIDFHNDAVGIAGVFSPNELYNDFHLALARSMSEFYQKKYDAIEKAECHFDGMAPSGSLASQATLDGFLYSAIIEYNNSRLSATEDRKRGQVENIGNGILAMVRCYIEN